MRHRDESLDAGDELRHRRISLWLRHGFDPVTVSQWSGHTRKSMTLDVYGHVVLDPRQDEWRDFWTAVYDASRRRGVVPVWSEEASRS
jgi:integrase